MSHATTHAFASTLKTFKTASGKTGKFHSLPALAKQFPKITRLPVSMRIVLESVLRNCDGAKVTSDHVRQLDGPARDSTEPNEHRCAYGARRMRGGEDPKIKEASFASWGTKRADGDVASAAPCPACPGRGSIYYSL